MYVCAGLVRAVSSLVVLYMCTYVYVYAYTCIPAESSPVGDICVHVYMYICFYV